MKKFSDVFNSIRFAKLDPEHDKSHKGGSTDDEMHYTVGEKEWEQQVKHVKKRAMQEEKETPPIGVRSLYTKMYAKHGGTVFKAKEAQSKAYAEVEKKHGKQMRDSLEAFHKKNMNEAVKDKFDIGEYDQEGDMAKSDLRSIIANAKRMHDMIEDSDNLPEWVQSKITKAEDYMSTVANYMEAEMNEAVKMPKQTRAEKEYRKITGKTVDQRLSELDKIQKDLAKQKEDYIKQGIIKSEEVEIEEGIGGTIAGGIGQFIGNKIDPLHGEIMRAHGEVAGRAAEYTIRKHLHRLHSALKKHLSSGTVSEEVEELDEGKYGAFRLGPGVGRFSSRGRAQHQGLEDPRTGLPLGFSHPPKKDEPKKDEPKKVKEEVEHLEEKNVPTSPEKWAQAKAQAKAKFDVYPSAYANGWAAKKYKEMGGGWKSVSEESELEEGYFKNQEIERQETERLAKKDDVPFKADKPKKKSVVVGKKPEGYSIARQLARHAMQKYMNKPVKEENEISKKAKIVKGIMKKDKFEANPIISKTVDDKQS